MHRLAVLAVVLIGCAGSPVEHGDVQPVEMNNGGSGGAAPVLMPPSVVVEDCSTGCGMVKLDRADTDVSYLVAAETTVTFDLSDNLCVRLSTPSESKSELKAVDSGYKLTGCQVFDNRNIFGRHYAVQAGPAGLPSWVRAEVGAAAYPGFCALSCRQVTP